MKVAVTGHRPNKLGNEYDLKGPYSEHIRKELQHIIDVLKPTLMISGMALGVDTIWAQLAEYNNIPLMAVIPFPDQDKVWREESKQLYRMLLAYAKFSESKQGIGGVKITGTDGYEAWKMNIRNEYMVNNCDLLVAVYNGDKSGGTYNCLTYAEKISKPILKINPNYENQDQSNEESIRAIERLWDSSGKTITNL